MKSLSTDQGVRFSMWFECRPPPPPGILELELQGGEAQVLVPRGVSDSAARHVATMFGTVETLEHPVQQPRVDLIQGSIQT